jgi:hypothetical protein
VVTQVIHSYLGNTACKAALLAIFFARLGTWVETWVAPDEQLFYIGGFYGHRFRQWLISKLPNLELFFRLFIGENKKTASAEPFNKNSLDHADTLSRYSSRSSVYRVSMKLKFTLSARPVQQACANGCPDILRRAHSAARDSMYGRITFVTRHISA